MANVANVAFRDALEVSLTSVRPLVREDHNCVVLVDDFRGRVDNDITEGAKGATACDLTIFIIFVEEGTSVLLLFLPLPFWSGGLHHYNK